MSRKEIDYIRGVNSGFVIRNLMIRGLVEKIEDQKDGRMFLYKPTFELLSFMGVSNVQDLPNFEEIRKEIESFKGSKEIKEEEKKVEEIEKTELEADDLNDDGQFGTKE
jgi:chromosome segregation and condensation protein ScpB